MITTSDALCTLDLGHVFAILPAGVSLAEYAAQNGGKPVAEGFHYNSAENTEWLSVAQLRDLIRQQVDPAFQPL